jgi:hypothetical protein
MLYGELSGVPWYEQVPAHAERLVLSEHVTTLGPGLARAAIADIPEYLDLVSSVHERLKWRAEDFTLHRLRVEYPVIATVLVVQFDLPETPPSDRPPL